jgi:hypothetical protein
MIGVINYYEKHPASKVFYRFREYNNATGYIDEFDNFHPTKYIDVHLESEEWFLVKETPKGYWITDKYGIFKKWISKTSRKRYAYPTKEEALKSYMIRKKIHIEILQKKLDIAKRGLELAKNITL